MNPIFSCKNKGRRLLIIDSPNFNGIDYLEVVSADQRTIALHFLKPLPGEVGGVPAAPPLTAENILITGGVRIQHIEVDSILSTNDRILTIRVNQTGDFSTYTLHLVTDQENKVPPANFDAQLAQIDFSFKANCPSDFDCKTEKICPPTELEPTPRINYLAKDYASFRRTMFDRLSLLMPGTQENNVADIQTTMVELMAYVGDHLSYYQDAIATEAYLFKARKRISLRRHARLLDYQVHNGNNARTWVQIGVTPGGPLDLGILPKSTPLLTKGNDTQAAISTLEFEQLKKQTTPLVFETMHTITLNSNHNEIPFYTWGDSSCCLLKGATSATLIDNGSLDLKEGDLLILEELISPTTGANADADPQKKHPIRLSIDGISGIDPLTNQAYVQITWHEEDALPFGLCISAEVDGVPLTDVSVARGNIVLADHGLTFTEQEVYPPNNVNHPAYYNPQLLHTSISVVQPYEHDSMLERPAHYAQVQDPKKAIPAIQLTANGDLWQAQQDLLNSDRFAKEFVPEVTEDGKVFLRFGDDITGARPGQGFAPKATYRVGNGTEGNIGRDALQNMVSDIGGVAYIRNPMPATGGQSIESLEEVRQFAPEAFKTQERAVNEADYAEKAMLHPEVQHAVAEFRWTGSWYTVFLTIDRFNGLPITDTFKQELIAHMEQYRMMGYDIAIHRPLFVPLEIEVRICVKKGYFKAQVRQQLQQTFTNAVLPNGDKGFFHPDHFTFGQPLYLSALYEELLAVEGVESVEVQQFKRQGVADQGEKRAGLITTAFNEIIRLDNDPNYPENGSMSFLIYGGI
ncbi:MAG: baseplate J/gp47 family protein [Bacteroidota bacterium]